MKCDCCGKTDGVQVIRARTAYEPLPFTREQRLLFPDPLNPPSKAERIKMANPDLPLCIDCADEYNSFYDERWTEYYESRL